MILVRIIILLLVLTVIVSIHEFGHFYAAKKSGVLCHEYSIGMGPTIYKKKVGETTYSIRALPIGGYVAMAGEEDSTGIVKENDEIGLNLKDGVVTEIILTEKKASDVKGKVVKAELFSRHGEMLEIELLDEATGVSTIYPVAQDAFYIFDNGTRQLAPYARTVESKSLWKRFMIFFAGPLMNFVLAIVICMICFIVRGTPNYKSTTIGSIDSDFPSYGVFEKGDKILSVGDGTNTYTVESWKQFSDKMEDLCNEGCVKVTVSADRKGTTITEVIDTYVVVNSIGLSNIQIDDKYAALTGTIAGAQVGNNGLRYKNKVGKKDTQISNGDIVTKIGVQAYNKPGTEIVWTDVSTWSEVINTLKPIDASNIYFEYYDCETSSYHSTLDDNQVVQSYTNEVMSSQNVDKVRIFIGVSPKYKHNIFASIKAGFKNFWSDCTLIVRTLKILIHPTGVRQVGVKNLSGVIGIYTLIKDYISAGFIALLLFVSLLSVNIGIMNLLPIPALDGGRIVFIIVEGIIHKPLNRKIEAWINNIMFILLMAFMLYIAWNDIMRIVHK